MYVIAVNKSQEFLLNVRQLYIYFFDDAATVFMSTHCIFFKDNTRDSTLTTSQCFSTMLYTTRRDRSDKIEVIEISIIIGSIR